MNDSSRAARTPGVERLPASACWEYLQQADLGRLAVINADGAPDIFPVNHRAYEGSLYIRTARDAKLLHIAQHPLVAYEVDGMTDDVLWSVVIRGRAERVTRDDELRDSGVRGLASWSPTAKLFAMRIAVNTISGRRFPAHGGHVDRLVEFEAEAAASAEEPAPHRGRDERPEPIPHFGPATGATPIEPDAEREG